MSIPDPPPAEIQIATTGEPQETEPKASGHSQTGSQATTQANQTIPRPNPTPSQHARFGRLLEKMPLKIMYHNPLKSEYKFTVKQGVSHCKTFSTKENHFLTENIFCPVNNTFNLWTSFSLWGMRHHRTWQVICLCLWSYSLIFSDSHASLWNHFWICVLYVRVIWILICCRICVFCLRIRRLLLFCRQIFVEDEGAWLWRHGYLCHQCCDRLICPELLQHHVYRKT